MLLSSFNVSIVLETVSPKADRILSSAKLCIEAISMKKNKSYEKLNKTDSIIVAISVLYLHIYFPMLKIKINQS